MLIDEAHKKVLARVDMEKISLKHASSTYGSRTSTGIPTLCVAPILFVTSNPHVTTIKALICVKPKGRPPIHVRLKPGKEQRMSKTKYSNYGLIGHDKRNCPSMHCKWRASIEGTSNPPREHKSFILRLVITTFGLVGLWRQGEI
ncbi:uncharacterized protein LOC105420804 [Amborella trichopoda]|uniref:uncharacterized protein LOC105420804 n=1 Tax=Amborella trichopoda TaxID=13333 RepID=UPI0009BEBCF1|nr:uncharacterized protein LOC105420804 [Amborella trichopoda]|eukprot:XP_020524232.1 uncharacterized protein LOC105420804 [Amborella trichopoda]